MAPSLYGPIGNCVAIFLLRDLASFHGRLFLLRALVYFNLIAALEAGIDALHGMDRHLAQLYNVIITLFSDKSTLFAQAVCHLGDKQGLKMCDYRS